MSIYKHSSLLTMIILRYGVVPGAPGPLVRGNFIATDVHLISGLGFRVSAETFSLVTGSLSFTTRDGMFSAILLALLDVEIVLRAWSRVVQDGVELTGTP